MMEMTAINDLPALPTVSADPGLHGAANEYLSATSIPACYSALLAADNLPEAAALIAAQAESHIEGVEATLLWALDADSAWSQAPPRAFSSTQLRLVQTAAATPNVSTHRSVGRGHLLARGAASADARAVLLFAFDCHAADLSKRLAQCETFLASVYPYLVESLEKARLRAALERLEQSEKLQRALFAIADMAASDQDMPTMLRGLHQIVSRLMYAENFYIALHDPVKDTICFLYFVDVAETSAMKLGESSPMSEHERSLTWYLIRDRHSLMGTQDEIRKQVSGPLQVLGADFVDWLGVPMIRGKTAYGALVVQSYVERPRYTEHDQTLLSFVASHILTALERKRAQEGLERRVELRTHELAEANRILVAEVQERVRGEELQRSLFRIAELSNTAQSTDDFYTAVHVIVSDLINAKNFYIALLSADARELEFPYFVDEVDTLPATHPLGAGLTEYVLRLRSPLLVDAAGIERLRAAGEVTLSGPCPQSWLGVPLICAAGMVGVVVVQSYSAQACYSAIDQQLLTFIAYQIANSLDRKHAAEALLGANADLERRVAERTRELREQISVRQLVELALQQRNADLEALNSTLVGTQSQLLQSDKMASIGQLAAGVAHEVNNPIGYIRSNLNSLTGYVQDIFGVLHEYEQIADTLSGTPQILAPVRALRQRINLDFLRKDIVDLLGESVEGVDRVERIVRDLKNFSHVDEAEWQQVDVHAGLETTLNVASHELKYKVEIVKDYGEVPPIKCLASQLNQVFLNLLVNAAHAIEKQGKITIRTRCDGAQVLIIFADTGKGIDPAHINRIFEPFFTTKPVGIGTGLGLSVSYGIIQKHGGTISVESELGKGTIFTISLPLDPQGVAAAREDRKVRGIA